MASSPTGLSMLKPPLPASPISRFSSRLKFPKIQLLRVNCDYSCFEVRDVSYQPPGTQLSLLKSVNFSLREKSFGLIFGQSGSGKTTLLQLLAGITKPTSGSIYIQKYGSDGNPSQSPQPLIPERVGIVLQFPERYFVADNVLDEVTFGWPRQKSDYQLKEHLALRLQRAINWVGLSGISLDKDPHSLSGGYKRRLALAIQLVHIPDLLILDEPLAGLDWKARADVVKLLKHLKKELTVLVVSHDLRDDFDSSSHIMPMQLLHCHVEHIAGTILAAVPERHNANEALEFFCAQGKAVVSPEGIRTCEFLKYGYVIRKTALLQRKCTVNMSVCCREFGLRLL